MKKLLRGFVALSMVLAMTGCGTGSSSSSDDLSSKKIGVIQLMKHIALDKSYEGFKDVLVDAGVKEENIDMTKSPRKAKTRNTSNNNTIDVSRERSRLGLDDFFFFFSGDNNHIDNYFSTYINNRSFYDMSYNINHEHSFAFANAINKVLNE